MRRVQAGPPELRRRKSDISYFLRAKASSKVRRAALGRGELQPHIGRSGEVVTTKSAIPTGVISHTKAIGVAALAVSFFASDPAKADVNLIEKDGWTVYTNGRVQAFFNYSQGDGYPSGSIKDRPAWDPNDPTQPADLNGDGVQDLNTGIADGNNNSVTLKGGGVDEANGLLDQSSHQGGKVQELRIRTGFVGNVLGFGVKRQVTPSLEIAGYYAVAAVINTSNRRKYVPVPVDARETHATISGPFGSLRFGRQSTLYNRGATELTYLYGFAYGLGWPGSISDLGANGANPGSAHVGFGVLGNGFGGGVVYSTPNLAGLTVNIGAFDSLSFPGTVWERNRWPRPETEITFEAPFNEQMGMKIFVNGMYQKLYQRDSSRSESLYGVGGGARFDLNPFHIGFAGHYGKAVGMSFALDPNEVIIDDTASENRTGDLRSFLGYYGQAMLSLGEMGMAPLDIHAGYGVTEVLLLDTDQQDLVDDDGDPNTVAYNDDQYPNQLDSPGFTPAKSQTGISAGLTYHLNDHLHAHTDVFLASFKWASITPAPTDGSPAVPEQNFIVANLGLTYDW